MGAPPHPALSLEEEMNERLQRRVSEESQRGCMARSKTCGSEWLSQESRELEKEDSLQIFDTTIAHIVVRVHTVRKQERQRERGT